MNHLSRLFAFTFLIVTTGQAREAAASVEVRLLSFPKKVEPAKLEVRIADGQTLALELPSHTLSEPVKLPRLPVWQFGHATAPADGQPGFDIHGECRPLASGKQLLIAAFQSTDPAAGESRVRIAALDSSSFKARQFLIMNLTPKEVAAQIGGKRFRLKPGGHRIVKPDSDRGEDLCFASLHTELNGTWRPFFTSNWPLDDESRGLVFIHQQPGTAMPRLHTIVDILPR